MTEDTTVSYTVEEFVELIESIYGLGWVARVDVVGDYAGSEIPWGFEACISLTPYTITLAKQLGTASATVLYVEYTQFGATGSIVLVDGNFIASYDGAIATHYKVDVTRVTVDGLPCLRCSTIPDYGSAVYTLSYAPPAPDGTTTVSFLYNTPIANRIVSVISACSYKGDTLSEAAYYAGSQRVDDPDFINEAKPGFVSHTWIPEETRFEILFFDTFNQVRVAVFKPTDLGNFLLPITGVDYAILDNENDTPSVPTPGVIPEPGNVNPPDDPTCMRINVFSWEASGVGLRVPGRLDQLGIVGLQPTVAGEWVTMEVKSLTGDIPDGSVYCIAQSPDAFSWTTYYSGTFRWVTGGVANVKVGRARVDFTEVPYRAFDTQSRAPYVVAVGTPLHVEPDRGLTVQWTADSSPIAYPALGAAGYAVLDPTVPPTAWEAPGADDGGEDGSGEPLTFEEIIEWITLNWRKVLVAIAVVVAIPIVLKITKLFTD